MEPVAEAATGTSITENIRVEIERREKKAIGRSPMSPPPPPPINRKKGGRWGCSGFQFFLLHSLETHQRPLCWLTQSTQYRSFAKLERKYENTKLQRKRRAKPNVDDLLDISGKRRKGRKRKRSKGIDTAVCCHSFRTTVLGEWGTLSPIMNRGTL